MNWPLFLFSMFWVFFSYAALEKNTLVYTLQGLVHIATLLPKDAVISQFSELPVVRKTIY